MRAWIVLAFMALGSDLVLAEEPTLGPAIEGYGPTYPIDDRDVPLDEDRTYSAVFDAAAYADGPTAQSTRLVSVARFYVCGQSMAFGGYPKSNLADPAQLALSAMTMLTVLQNDGYALLQ